mmetsp:Transcript_22502/g.29162  ORF Transcript_22502/g.29162 Transcript_22502/m.29162 type:complete len:712 (+) Transcript_22502:86-2221(+)
MFNFGRSGSEESGRFSFTNMVRASLGSMASDVDDKDDDDPVVSDLSSSEIIARGVATPPASGKKKLPPRKDESPPELNADVLSRNMTRRAGGRETMGIVQEDGLEDDDENEKMLSIGGEGRLLQLESANTALRVENDKLRGLIQQMQLSPRHGGRNSSLGTASSTGSLVGRRSSQNIIAKTKQRQRKAHILRDSMLYTLDENGREIHVSRNEMSRTASIGTARLLRNLPRRASSLLTTQNGKNKRLVKELANRIIHVFRDPLQATHVEYLSSAQFADDILDLADSAMRRFELEPRVLRLDSPSYVFGDVHGNLEDLNFFADHVWKLGVSLMAGNLLFLGDYVDRGLSSLEVVSYLLALKAIEPNKVWLLRGNHETRDVNGWKEHYGERSFLWQCENRFGIDIGTRVWDALNACFDRLPLAAIIDDDVFCVHGGFPRRPSADALRAIAPTLYSQLDTIHSPSPHSHVTENNKIGSLSPSNKGGFFCDDAASQKNATANTIPPSPLSRRISRSGSILRNARSSSHGLESLSRLDLLDLVPAAISINPPDPECEPILHQMASECVWSDPAMEDQENFLDQDGFGESMRGGGTVCFGQKAIDAFLLETGCSFIMRAHEAHAYGVSLGKMATVFTVFSTSKDHHQGNMASCGCVLVDLAKLQVINRSPHYKNKFIHKRHSAALAGLSQAQLAQRASLGLILPNDDEFDDDDDLFVD